MSRCRTRARNRRALLAEVQAEFARKREDLIAASVREATCHFRHEVNTTSPEARKAHRRNIVREVIRAASDAKEQERSYTARTGAPRADFYRRKREVESGEFDESDAA